VTVLCSDAATALVVIVGSVEIGSLKKALDFGFYHRSRELAAALIAGAAESLFARRCRLKS
jgi:hypothetical protein